LRTSVGRLARQPRAFEVELADDALEAVVGLADARRRERIRGGDVGTGGQVATMDVQDHVRARQIEQIGIACDLLRVVEEALAAIVGGREAGALNHRPPGAVEHEDPLAE
jgi:hypothetical protein